MIIRAVTFWITLLVLLLTIAIPIILNFGGYLRGGRMTDHFVDKTGGTALLWLFSGSPLLVSCLVAKNLKYAIPSLILLMSSLVYAIFYVWVVYQFVFDMLGFLVLFLVGFVSLPVLIPVWGVTTVFEYVLRQENKPLSIPIQPGDDHDP